MALLPETVRTILRLGHPYPPIGHRDYSWTQGGARDIAREMEIEYLEPSNGQA